ncbi:MAG: ABC transporter permease [Oscillospiraceae bacterium]|nr:ABC transporter permease [Oscillospiraceae bacterium]
MKGYAVNRISFLRELMLRIDEGWRVLRRERRNLIISLLFPVIAAAVTVWIAGENMFVNCESTKSACFILVCAAIWGGLFNSIQTVVKERKMIKRDYVSGAMRIGCYTASRAFLQLLLCAFQAAILCMSFYGVKWAYENELPEMGLIFDDAMLEYYITVFLVMYAADALGLMISCFVRSEQLASQLSPYILIVQLLFSGVLFAMEGAAQSVSALMLSRWGMEALGSISNLNELPLRLQEEFPYIPHEADEAFAYTAEHLWQVWLILLVFVIVPLVAGNILLHGVKKDSRG